MAIDGPVAVGKSTVARRVAATLGIRHLDTGAMYRAVAWKSLREDPEGSRVAEVAARIAREETIELGLDGCVVLSGEDITEAIRAEGLSARVGQVADVREVREALVAQQRRLGAAAPSVLEGRDIGTVVFPDAAIRVYLDASPEVRVARRLAQHAVNGVKASEEEVRGNLAERDERDRGRPWGGLRVAPGARILDTTDFTEDRVVELIAAMARCHPAFAREAAP